MKKLWFLIIICCVLFSVGFANYSKEEEQAYIYAYKNNITTMNSIDKANMWWNLTRIAMAKMLSNYAINVLGLTPDTSKNCYFSDVSDSLDYQYDNWVKKACQLGLMWVWIDQFYPNWVVTRAEFWTVLSRALNWKDTAKLNIMNNTNPYYSEHLNYLKEEWIMNNIANPTNFERRWRVMLMLMRADKNYSWVQITSYYDQLDDVVATCHTDDKWGYDYDINKRQYIIPYKNWYIGYNYGWNWEWRGYYLTYKSLDNPCVAISTSDEIFFWHAHYKYNKETFNLDVFPDDKVYIAQWWWSGIPIDIIAKVLNCTAWEEMGERGYNTCKKEVDRFMYNLIVWNEQNDYFTKWMNKFKQDIDNGNYTKWNQRSDNWNRCISEHSWESLMEEYWEDNRNLSEQKRQEYQKIRNERIHECIKEYLKN